MKHDIRALQHTMAHFLLWAPASEDYRVAIEHKVGFELTSAARECSRQMSVQSALSTSLVCAPKRKSAIECCMVLYGLQSLHTHSHTLSLPSRPLLAHPLGAPSWRTLLAHPLGAPSRRTLLAHPLGAPSWRTLSAHPLGAWCSRRDHNISLSLSLPLSAPPYFF